MLEKYLHHLYFQQELYPFEMLAAVKLLVFFSLCWYHHQNHFLWVWGHGAKFNKEEKKKTVMVSIRDEFPMPREVISLGIG